MYIWASDIFKKDDKDVFIKINQMVIYICTSEILKTHGFSVHNTK